MHRFLRKRIMMTHFGIQLFTYCLTCLNERSAFPTPNSSFYSRWLFQHRFLTKQILILILTLFSIDDFLFFLFFQNDSFKVIHSFIHSLLPELYKWLFIQFYGSFISFHSVSKNTIYCKYQFKETF